MNIDTLEDYIKNQAEIFLLELGEFYPFGCAIDITGELKPIGVYLEGEEPSVIELIELLEVAVKQKLNDNEYIIAAIAINISIKHASKNCDAIEIRFFEKGDMQFKTHIKYKKELEKVTFIDVA